MQEQDDPLALATPLKKLVISDKVNRTQRTAKGNKASTRAHAGFRHGGVECRTLCLPHQFKYKES
jgi:hypothetical protein